MIHKYNDLTKRLELISNFELKIVLCEIKKQFKTF